ncbi:MAG: P-loop NTPase, partial [Clostridia bacterium]|nr:P-loop NTPase [Clostridia bacterium]
LVAMIVEKAVKMADMMNVPILGVVENMSYFQCPECGKRHNIFGNSRVDEIAEKFKTKVLAKLPIDTNISASQDNGAIENIDKDYFV